MKVENGGHELLSDTQAVIRLVLHEARTPLNAICGFTDLLLAGAGGPLSAESLDYVEQVAHAGRALERGLGHLRELATVDARPSHPGAAVDLVAGLTAAGFIVAGTGHRLTVRGDAAAWARLAETCRAYLQAEGRRLERPEGPRAVFDHKSDGRLELTLSDPAALPAPGTGLLALELARRLAGLAGGELVAPEPNRIVIAWPPGSWSIMHRTNCAKASRADALQPGA